MSSSIERDKIRFGVFGVMKVEVGPGQLGCVRKFKKKLWYCLILTEFRGKF